MLIAIIGPDGCGKTTIANYIGNKAYEFGYNGAEHIASNFNIIPKLGDIKGKLYKLMGKNYVNKNIHDEGELLGGMKHEPNSALKGSALIVWYTLDYFLGYFSLRKWRKERKVVIFARYFYDYYFQRAYINIPKPLCMICDFFVPKPDLIIFLKRSPQAIFDGKPELSVEEIARQNTIIEAQFSHRKGFVCVHADSGLNETLQKIDSLLSSGKRA